MVVSHVGWSFSSLHISHLNLYVCINGWAERRNERKLYFLLRPRCSVRFYLCICSASSVAGIRSMGNPSGRSYICY